MVFSSSLFLLYFLPVFLVIYYQLPSKLKNYFILLASILFYSWGTPDFIFIVIASIIIDYYLIKFLSCSSIRRKRRWLLALSVMLNIGLLAYFKYANFFIENVNDVLKSFGFNEINWVSIVLPIGISFFTFQKLTYSIDVYRRVHRPLRKVTDYALYILMFPQLIAGPIVRFNEIADQIENHSQFENVDNRLLGFFRFTIGLAKKVLIANVLGEYVDTVFSMSVDNIGTATAWIGIIAYAFQIYFDFSGYSDMAIGIGKIIGFTFPENFNNPYISRNITEFWRRWHITLGNWMRDYLYIPLGGNRVKTKNRLYFNLWIVFIISGLWHGAAWNFVIWGIYHGFFLIIDRIFLIRLLNKIGKAPSVLITFIVVLVGWVLFRSPDMQFASGYFKSMFSFDFDTPLIYLSNQFVIIAVIGAFFSFFALIMGIEKWQIKLLTVEKGILPYIVLTLIGIILMIVSIAAITSSGFNPFIYFRF